MLGWQHKVASEQSKEQSVLCRERTRNGYLNPNCDYYKPANGTPQYSVWYRLISNALYHSFCSFLVKCVASLKTMSNKYLLLVIKYFCKIKSHTIHFYMDFPFIMSRRNHPNKLTKRTFIDKYEFKRCINSEAQ